jgi:Flp pilus assembly protein TadG
MCVLARRRTLIRSDRAQSLVEFALIVPILLILVFGIIDFGMGLRAYISVSSATREGARFAIVGNAPGTFTSGGAGERNGSTTTTAVGKVCQTISGLNLANLQKVNVQVCDTASPPVCSTATTSNMLSGKSIRVTADYQYHYITPVKALINVLSAGALSSSLAISSTTDMRIE